MYRAVVISIILALGLISSASAEGLLFPEKPAEPSPAAGVSFLNDTGNASSTPSAVSTADLVALSSTPLDPPLLYSLGRYDELLEIYNHSVENNPCNVEAWYYRGNILGQMGRYNESIECFDRVIDLVPSFSGAWRLMGVSLDHLEKYDQALGYYNRAIDLDDDYARGAKKTTLKKLGRYSEADKLSGRWDPLSGYMQSLPDKELQDYLHKKRML
jgi:tetratricopeptide (TPR) repeat protein